MPEQVVPAGMGGEPGHHRNAKPIQVVRELVQLGTAIWRTPLFGMSAQRLYAVSVSAGEPASLHDFERDGSLRVIAARSDRSLHETDLNPGETCYVASESEEAVARNPPVALWQTATSRARQPSKTFVALGLLTATRPT